MFYGFTVNCLFGTVVCKLFFPLSVVGALFLSLFWLSFVAPLLAEFAVSCPDKGGLEAAEAGGEYELGDWALEGVSVGGGFALLLAGAELEE